MSEYKTLDDIMADNEMVELLGLDKAVPISKPRLTIFNRCKTKNSAGVLRKVARVLIGGNN